MMMKMVIDILKAKEDTSQEEPKTRKYMKMKMNFQILSLKSLSDTTNQLNLFSNHPRRNIESSCPHTHFKKSRSTTKQIQASSSSLLFFFSIAATWFWILEEQNRGTGLQFPWSHNIVIYPLIVFTIVLVG